MGEEEEEDDEEEEEQQEKEEEEEQEEEEEEEEAEEEEEQDNEDDQEGPDQDEDRLLNIGVTGVWVVWAPSMARFESAQQLSREDEEEKKKEEEEKEEKEEGEHCASLFAQRRISSIWRFLSLPSLSSSESGSQLEARFFMMCCRRLPEAAKKCNSTSLSTATKTTHWGGTTDSQRHTMAGRSNSPL
jgi:hypothetical protein